MNGTTQTDSQQYVPPKMWKDLTVEEKVERMREQMKQDQYSRANIGGQVQDLKSDFQNHSHSEGKVVKDVKTYNSGIGGLAKLSDPEAEAKGEVYF